MQKGKSYTLFRPITFFSFKIDRPPPPPSPWIDDPYAGAANGNVGN